MNLDELKNSWNKLDDQLKGKSLAGDEQIARIISHCKEGASRSLLHIRRFQRRSLWSACIVMPLLLLLEGYLITNSELAGERLLRHEVMLGFVIISFLAAVGWDLYTYRLVSRIRVDTMPVAEVSRRMQFFRNRTRMEVWGICIWLLLFFGVCYWSNGIYEWPAKGQIAFAAIVLLFDAALVGFLYHHFVYRHLHAMQHHLDQLHDVCSE